MDTFYERLHTNTHTRAPTCTPTHPHTPTPTHTLTHTHTHTHTLTHMYTQATQIRLALAKIYEDEQNWRKSADVLCGIPMDSGQK